MINELRSKLYSENSFIKYAVFIFRTTISMGEENHDLCCVFFPIFATTPPYTNSTYSASLLRGGNNIQGENGNKI